MQIDINRIPEDIRVVRREACGYCHNGMTSGGMFSRCDFCDGTGAITQFVSLKGILLKAAAATPEISRQNPFVCEGGQDCPGRHSIATILGRAALLDHRLESGMETWGGDANLYDLLGNTRYVLQRLVEYVQEKESAR